MTKKPNFFFTSFIFIFITLVYSNLPKSIAYADPNLDSFQQELLSRSKVAPPLPNKPRKMLSAAQAPLPPAQTMVDLKEQAQQLMDELEKQNDRQSTPPVSSKLLEYKPVTLTPAKKSGPLQDKPAKETPLLKKKPEVVKRWWIFEQDYSKAFTEGDSLYRVAISDRVLTIKEAQDISLANSAALMGLKKKIEAAEAKLFEAKRGLFPTVQYQLEQNGGIFNDRFYKGRNWKVNVTQPLYYGGELQLTVSQAAENVVIAKKEYSKARGELIHQVRSAYYKLVQAEYNVQYHEELLAKGGVLHERILKERANKVIPEIDYLNVESQYQQIIFQVDSSKNDLLSARLVFTQALGISPEQKAPVDLRLDFKKQTPSFDDMLYRALKNNPDVQIKASALQSALYGVQIFDARRKPRIDLRGSYGNLGEAHRDDIALEHRPIGLSGETGNPDIDLEKEWFLGIKGSMPLGPNSIEYETKKNVYAPTVSSFQGGSIDWRNDLRFNLFDKLSDITDEKSAEAALYQAQADYDKARNEVISKLREDFYNLQKSLIQVDSATAKVKYQDKQNALLEYMLSLQETQAANLMEGWTESAQNKYSFIQAVSDYKIALSSLASTIGDPDYFEQKS